MPNRIVICDDELSIVKAAEFKLKKAGYQVRTAANGEDAWQLIQAELPAMLVTDYQMPRLDGLALIARLRGEVATATLPIILLTAKRMELNVREIVERFSLAAILAKPFSPRELAQLVERAIGPVAPLSTANTPQPLEESLS